MPRSGRSARLTRPAWAWAALAAALALALAAAAAPTGAAEHLPLEQRKLLQASDDYGVPPNGYSGNAGVGGAEGLPPPAGLLTPILQWFAVNSLRVNGTDPGGPFPLTLPVNPSNFFTPVQSLGLYVGQPGAGGFGSL